MCIYIYIHIYIHHKYIPYILYIYIYIYQWIFIAIIAIIVVVPLLQRLYDFIWQVMGHKPLPIPSPNIKLPVLTYLTPAAPKKTYSWLYTSYAHSQCVTVLLIIPIKSNGIRVFLLFIPMIISHAASLWKNITFIPVCIRLCAILCAVVYSHFLVASFVLPVKQNSPIVVICFDQIFMLVG